MADGCPGRHTPGRGEMGKRWIEADAHIEVLSVVVRLVDDGDGPKRM